MQSTLDVEFLQVGVLLGLQVIVIVVQVGKQVGITEALQLSAYATEKCTSTKGHVGSKEIKRAIFGGSFVFVWVPLRKLRKSGRQQVVVEY